ncbi:MAG: ABC transporter ATP-binding protein [Erysipelotrichaceae bacterium]
MNDIKFLNKYVKKYQGYLFLLVLVILLYSFFNLIGPLVISFYIDNVINLIPIENEFVLSVVNYFGGINNLHVNLWMCVLLVALIRIIVSLISFVRIRLNSYISEGMVKQMRDDLYYAIENSRYENISENKTGDLIQKCTSDVNTIFRFFSGQLNQVVSTLFTFIVAFTLMLNINVLLSVISLICVPFIYLSAYKFSQYNKDYFTKSDEREAEMTDVLSSDISGIRVIKAFNKEEFEYSRFDKYNKNYKDTTFKLIRLLGIYHSLSDIIVWFQTIIVIVVGVILSKDNIITLGQFFVFLTYMEMVLWPIKRLGHVVGDFSKMQVSCRRLQEVVDLPLEDLKSGSCDDLNGDIVFDHVTFAYPDNLDHNVLDDVSFRIKKGSTVVIMGKVASGKSSLVSLLTRLYDNYSGAISLNGHDIKDVNKKYLRDRISLILQETFLYSKSIKDNINIKNNANEDLFKKVSEITMVDDFVKDFNDSYDTLVGEKGVTLSGGQKQRIAIARSIINDIDVLIFDDSLSALDNNTSKVLKENIHQFSGNITSVIITSSIVNALMADEIIILDHGKIIEQGDVNTLLKKGGYFKHIYDIQKNYQGDFDEK